MLGTEVAKIDLTLNDNIGETISYDSPVLELLRFPNATSSGRAFMEQLAIFYLLMGNAFVIATGKVNQPPKELLCVNPMSVTLACGPDGYLETITVATSDSNPRIFTRKSVDGRFRYFSQDAEIWHFKAFSAKVFSGDLWGMSSLTPIVVELDQYLEASNHNLSLLKRGARPSGALKFDEPLSDDQFQRYQQQVDRFYSGARNAGRLLLLENAEFQQMSMTNADMDFAALKSSVTNTIYTSLRIPLPLTNADATTYDNMSTSIISFYDNAVLPLLDKLLEEMTAFLIPRFNLGRGTVISYDPEGLTVLEPRRVEKIAILQNAGVLTINELRHALGYGPVDDGDEVYIQAAMIPLSQERDVAEIPDLNVSKPPVIGVSSSSINKGFKY